MIKACKIRDTRYLLTVLMGATATAVAWVGILLWWHNPSGLYLAKAVLMDPIVFSQIQEKVRDPETGRWLYYTFGKLIWEKEGESHLMSLEEYQQFFADVAEKRSTRSYPHKMFGKESAKMTLWLHASSQAPDRLLQEVEFSENGDFRVHLSDGTWAYFTM